jgi:hypothetical protein
MLWYDLVFRSLFCVFLFSFSLKAGTWGSSTIWWECVKVGGWGTKREMNSYSLYVVILILILKYTK